MPPLAGVVFGPAVSLGGKKHLMVCVALASQFAAPLAVADGGLGRRAGGRGGCWVDRLGEEPGFLLGTVWFIEGSMSAAPQGLADTLVV